MRIKNKERFWFCSLVGLVTLMFIVAGEMVLSPGQIYGGAKLIHDPLGDRYLIEKIIRLFGVIAGINRSADRQEEADRVRDTVTALLEMREEWRDANCERN